MDENQDEFDNTDAMQLLAQINSNLDFDDEDGIVLSQEGF